jgi:hypothetical protein
MPNWCENDLYIYGPDRTAVLDAISSKDGAFDFERVVPMPAVLAATEKSSDVTWGRIILGENDADAREYLKYGWAVAAGLTTVEALKAFLAKEHPTAVDAARRAQAAYAETGYWDWYDWSVNHWGTKWNASAARLDRQERRDKLTFSTAWSPPRPVVAALGRRFPANTFSLRFYERGAALKGRFKVRGARVLVNETAEYRGRRGG